jgi:molybdopterin converting factor small subunit
MRITVRLFGALRSAAAGGRGEIELEVPEGTTPAGVIERLKIDPRMSQVTLVNGEQAVDRTAPLADGDRLEILPPVAGG